MLRRDEGGRHKPFFSGYRPQFYIRTMDVTGNITLPADVEMVMPGDRTNMQVELIIPVALEQGSNFAIREGGLTVGAGVITETWSKPDSSGIILEWQRKKMSVQSSHWNARNVKKETIQRKRTGETTLVAWS